MDLKRKVFHGKRKKTRHFCGIFFLQSKCWALASLSFFYRVPNNAVTPARGEKILCDAGSLGFPSVTFPLPNDPSHPSCTAKCAGQRCEQPSSALRTCAHTFFLTSSILLSQPKSRRVHAAQTPVRHRVYVCLSPGHALLPCHFPLQRPS